MEGGQGLRCAGRSWFHSALKMMQTTNQVPKPHAQTYLRQNISFGVKTPGKRHMRKHVEGGFAGNMAGEALGKKCSMPEKVPLGALQL